MRNIDDLKIVISKRKHLLDVIKALPETNYLQSEKATMMEIYQNRLVKYDAKIANLSTNIDASTL